MPAMETEVKFHVADREAMRRKLLSIGADSLGRCHEHNLRFEDRDRGLGRRGMLLRLRRDRKATLTFKSIPAGADPNFKQMHEIEVEVNDFESMQRLLAALGFLPVQRYEKWRESFRYGEALFCLDTLPYGDFLEIEGRPEEIPGLAARLGLDWQRRIVGNYLEIFDLIRARHRLDAADLTFRGLAGVALDLAALLPLIESGGAQPSSETIFTANSFSNNTPPSRSKT
jgi:adenylate cyclase class 2